MCKKQSQELVDYLQQFVTPERWETLNKVINQRTRFLAVVLENIYQPHNASAVLRSCDCFGIQDIHIIENSNEFNPNTGVTIGADQWLSIHRYNRTRRNNTKICYQTLRDNGYSIIAATPHESDVTIDKIPLNNKTALVFGAEYTGLSDDARKHADGHAKISMAGFSESLNISVGAAICLYELSKRLKDSHDNWMLNDHEKTQLRLEWLRKSIRASDKIIERYRAQNAKT